MNRHIKGIGTDIIEIERLKKAIQRKGQVFIETIFTEKEIKYCFKFKNSFAHFAARFAAKEAVAKAFGCGFGKNFSFKDVELINNEKGRPEIQLSKKAKNKFKFNNIDISISHSDCYAIAFCIIS